MNFYDIVSRKFKFFFFCMLNLKMEKFIKICFKNVLKVYEDKIYLRVILLMSILKEIRVYDYVIM